ncbi:MAG: thiosulfate oxidation carrier protein SoxY [Pseudomonadota bacterium]
MNAVRRSLLRGAGSAGAISIAIAAGLLKPTQVMAAWNESGFDAKSVADAMAAIGAGGAVNSKEVLIKTPDIAENGAVVPVDVVTDLPNVESIALFGEKNTFPLVGQYNLTDFDGLLTTRIKLGTTSNVRAVVKAGGKYYTATKEVKVTLGGCGG